MAGILPPRPRSTRLQVVERSALVTFTPAQMFALVNDIARYPEFLPWCVDAQVEELSATERMAAVNVAKGPVRMRFATRNTVKADSQILMQLAEGPFSHLEGRWNFDAVGERGSRVLFRVEFEFKSRLMSAALSPVFQSICDSIVDAFVRRAQGIYG
jgi:ribosome-associated toxin RatA of RatAB toxin-antitoxin module